MYYSALLKFRPVYSDDDDDDDDEFRDVTLKADDRNCG